MANETKLVLAFFDSEAAADEAAGKLRDWDLANEGVKVGNIGVLVKDWNGQIKQRKLGPRKGAKGAGIGTVLGLVAAIPTGGMSLLGGAIVGGASGGVLGALFHKGLPKEDVDRIGSELDAGHAAVGVLLEEDSEPRVRAKLAELGGTTEAHAVSVEGLEEADASTTPVEETEDVQTLAGDQAAATAVQLTLDTESAQILQEVLERYLTDLRGEIGGTGSYELRLELHRRKDVLQGIVDQIAQLSHV